jgi:hypothetical protein
VAKNAGCFKRGHEKRGGRKRGTANAFTSDIKKAVVRAAHLVGEDLAGKDGIVGYFRWVAENHSKVYASVILKRMLQVASHFDVYHSGRPSMEEIEAGAIAYTVEDEEPWADEIDPNAPYAWTGRGYPLGPLMDMAVRDPKSFCQLFADAFLQMPGLSRRRSAISRAWRRAE